MERKQKRVQRRAISILLLTACLLLAAAVLAIGIGSVYIPPERVLAVLWGSADGMGTDGIIVRNMRLTRILGSMVGGAALALAGLLMQILFGNPIADPYILGISSGARMVVGFVLLGGITLQLPFADSPWFLFWGAFLGALLVMLLMLVFANRFHNITIVLIAGMMIGYFCSAVVNTLVAFSDDNRIADFTRWNLGSFGLLSWQKLKVLVFVCLLMFLAAVLLSKNLNLLAMGEDYAQTMGVHTRQMRLWIIVVSGVLTAVVTAFCDLIARTIAAPGELPVGIITSFVGVPLVLYLLCRQQGGRW